MPNRETYYWPRWFSRGLNTEEQARIKTILPALQRGQAFLWRALNIYDDFLDGTGRREQLITANEYFRRYLEIHCRLGLPDDYYQLSGRLWKNLETANRSELTAPRLKIRNGRTTAPARLGSEPILTSLSRKSLPLALGPIAVLSFLGYRISDPKTKATLNFFRYALAAKQLADDSQDWREDLESGLITAANRPILIAAQKRKTRLDLASSRAAIDLLFAQEASPLIIKGIKSLCSSARREMMKINGRPGSILLDKLVLPLENSCREAERFRAMLT